MSIRSNPAPATPPPALKMNFNGHLDRYDEDNTPDRPRLPLPRYSVFEVISTEGRFWGSLEPPE